MTKSLKNIWLAVGPANLGRGDETTNSYGESCTESSWMATVQENLQGATLPLAMQVCIGFATLFAAGAFFAFLNWYGIFNGEAPELVFLLWGGLCIGIALGLYGFAQKNAQTTLHDVMIPISLSSMILGKFLFGTGCLVYFSPLYYAGYELFMALISLMLTALLYPFYRVSVDRFLSTLVTLFFFFAYFQWGMN